MRPVWIAALLLAAGRVEARPLTPPSAPPAPTDFWREMLEPHGREVSVLVERAQRAQAEADDTDTAPAGRLRAARTAYALLRHARQLAPENPEVLRLLGNTADELGKAAQALTALEACARIEGPERAGVEVTGRLGMIYLRLGRLDDAVRWLGHAQGPIARAEHAAAAVHLATALAARGQMSDAIDHLVNALPVHGASAGDPITLVSLALAVHYDRDEQAGAAFDVLARMQVALQQELGSSAQRALGLLRFAPPEDRDYYLALLYEALGATTEARAEWALYAQIPDAPWRDRALQHIRLLDTQPPARAGRPTPPTRPVP